MKKLFLKRCISLLLSILIVSVSLVTTAATETSGIELIDIKENPRVSIGENLYTHEVADGVFPSDWTRYEAPWIWNVKSQAANITASSGRNPAYVTLNNTDGSHTSTSGAVVFPSVGTADYVLTVKMRIGNEYGHFGLITNLTGTDGGTLSYVTLNKSGSQFAGNGSVTLANRWGNGSQTTQMNYESSNIATSANGGMVYPGATLTMKAYSCEGYTYFYINDVLMASGAQRNPEEVNSLCGVYCYNGKFQIYSVSIDALDVKKDIKKDVKITTGENLYTHEVADGVFPSDWTRYEAPWIWNVKSQDSNITVSSGRNPAYVTLNNTDGSHTNTSGAVVFPSVGTADYVLTVKMRIGNEYGHFGLITNLTGTEGGTLSYVTLNKSGSSFAGNGSVTLANRWGTGSQTTKTNYQSSNIATSANGGMVYPGATLTLQAYSYDGFTYFYINDVLVASGAQRNPEDVNSLCGVYCCNGKFQIYSVSIDALDVKKDIREDERVSVGGNLYTHEVADGVFPSDWTRYEAPWIWSVKSQAANITVSSNKTPAYVTLNNCDGAHTNTSGAVVFPSVDTADYVLTVKMRIGNEYGHFGLITNLTGTDGGTLSYVKLNKSSTSVFAGNGSAELINRWGNGSQTTQMSYESSLIATSANGGMIYPGATLTMQAYSFEGYTYFYINDEFVACGPQRNPEEIKSLCGVYCYNGKFQIYSVSIDALESQSGTTHRPTNSIKMLGASVRYADEMGEAANGFRFVANMDKNSSFYKTFMDGDYVVDNAANFQVGILIMPTNRLNKGELITTETPNVGKVIADIYSQDSNEVALMATILNIPQNEDVKGLDMSYTARAYVTIGNNSYYSDQIERSPASVANKFYVDNKNMTSDIKEKLDKVFENSDSYSGKDVHVNYDEWRTHPEDYKLLAFTFDDGPDNHDPSVTIQVADILSEYNGSGTFFFIGKSFDSDRDVEIAKYVNSTGHEIGSHSYNHISANDMDSMSDEDFKKEFEGANELIKSITGVTPKFWRASGYSYSERVYEHLEEIGMTAAGLHTAIGADWSGGDATVDEMVATLLNDLPDGAIIGAHSSNGSYITPEALSIALPQLYEQGYRFCTLSELVEYKGLSTSELPIHSYITRIETLEDGTPKVHTMFRLYLDSWKSHPEDYKLLAFTFDDGPDVIKDNRMVELFAKYKGSATMFVTGTQCEIAGYSSLQNAINNGWDIGNHSMTHRDAHNGGTGSSYSELTYDELKYEICNMNDLLSSNLTMADGITPYKVSLYRPPQIRTTDNLFKICAEQNMPVIWLSQNTYDWSSAYDYNARLQNMKNGIGTWEDGDVILGHIWSDDTYNCLNETLEAFYDAGYRFCSITELMEYRGIESSDISGKLNNVDGNKGCVRNIVKSATYGKAEN